MLRNLLTVAALSGSLLIGACGGGGGGESGGAQSSSQSPAVASPTIQSFTASPAAILPGQTATLRWTASGATTLTIDHSVGAVSGGSHTVSPTSSVTYTLTAGNGAGSTSATATVTVGAHGAQYASMASADLGAGANLNGGIPFPADNAWNTDISGVPVDPNSDNLIASIGLTRGLHPDFGAGLYAGAAIGIPYVVVAGTQARVSINFSPYGAESDAGPYPIPSGAPIEGQQADGSASGDSHVIVIDKDNNRLYELFSAVAQANGSWNAASGAVFHLNSNAVRPTAQPGWTSADAAGMPIFPGLARYEEAASGSIAHALRFTVNVSRRAYLPPATHSASTNTSANVPPMGTRVRLKASYVIPSSFSPEVKAILQALKTYGMFVADNGSNWFVSGAPDSRWNNDSLVSELGSVKGSNFEVVRIDGLVIN
jgi:hypothetical protein